MDISTRAPNGAPIQPRQDQVDGLVNIVTVGYVRAYRRMSPLEFVMKEYMIRYGQIRIMSIKKNYTKYLHFRPVFLICNKYGTGSAEQLHEYILINYSWIKPYKNSQGGVRRPFHTEEGGGDPILNICEL